MMTSTTVAPGPNAARIPASCPAAGWEGWAARYRWIAAMIAASLVAAVAARSTACCIGHHVHRALSAEHADRAMQRLAGPAAQPYCHALRTSLSSIDAAPRV